jgi:hypothetical protein
MDAVNYVIVLAAAVVAYAVGALWHSPIGFGTYWMQLMGLKREDMGRMPLTPMQAMVIGFFITLLQAFVLAYLMVLINASDLNLALTLGFWVWLGFLAPTLINGWLWEGKSWKLFAFNAAYALVSVEVMAAILGLWH